MLMEGAQRYQKFSNFDEAYRKYILGRRQIWENLNRLTDQDARSTIIEFLKAWRIRNTGRIVPSKLREKLQRLSMYFQVFRNKHLITINFDEGVVLKGRSIKISEVVKEIFGKLLGNGIGPTSTAKIMHGVNPEVFMMWDGSIREGYGYAGNEVGYLRFLKEAREILLRMASHLREADRSATKLLDEYNYMKFTQEEDLPDPF